MRLQLTICVATTPVSWSQLPWPTIWTPVVATASAPPSIRSLYSSQSNRNAHQVISLLADNVIMALRVGIEDFSGRPTTPALDG